MKQEKNLRATPKARRLRPQTMVKNPPGNQERSKGRLLGSRPRGQASITTTRVRTTLAPSLAAAAAATTITIATTTEDATTTAHARFYGNAACRGVAMSPHQPHATATPAKNPSAATKVPPTTAAAAIAEDQAEEGEEEVEEGVRSRAPLHQALTKYHRQQNRKI